MKVKVNNLGIIKSAELEFVNGLNILVGPSSSGKSTLLRGIKNLVDNSFSDSSVKSNESKMKIEIEDNNHTVSYIRDLNNPSRKSMYIVDGEQYTKIGRLPLEDVQNALNIKVFNIDDNNFYFNFSSQFSGPFLLFESKSFLYSVLTYRSTVDITEINDLFSKDLKETKKLLNESIVRRDVLTSSINSNLTKLEELNSVPCLYNNFYLIKDKKDNINRLNNLIAKYNSSNNFIANSQYYIGLISKYIALYNSLESVVNKIYLIERFKSISDKIYSLKCYIDKLSDVIRKYDDCINSGKLISLLKKLFDINRRIDIENNLVINFNKLDSSSHKIIVINDMIELHNNMNESNCKLKDYEEEILHLNQKISCIKVCPLCGTKLEHNEKGVCDEH